MEKQFGHAGFRRLYAPGTLTLGLMFPVARVERTIPDMHQQLQIAQRAERLGFAALWARDVPLYDPAFGDVGQLYDPWVWLGAVASQTALIALSTAGIVLPLRHPLHVAKAAASLDVITRGRFVLGLASGDRPAEYPAFGIPYHARAERFRESFDVIRRSLHHSFPAIESSTGAFQGVDLLPKPYAGYLPSLIIGTARQTVEWIAEHADGWVTYPRDADAQLDRIALWRQAVDKRARGRFRPFTQSLFLDLDPVKHRKPTPINLGYRVGSEYLTELLFRYQSMGVNHVILNLRNSTRPIDEVLHELAEDVLPAFPSHVTNTLISPTK